MVFILNESNHEATLASIFSSGYITDYFTCRIVLAVESSTIKHFSQSAQMIQKEQDHLLSWLSPYPQIKEIHHHHSLVGRRAISNPGQRWYTIWLTSPSIEHKSISKTEIIYQDNHHCLICCHKYPNFVSRCQHQVYCRDCVAKWQRDYPQKDLTCAECWKVL